MMTLVLEKRIIFLAIAIEDDRGGDSTSQDIASWSKGTRSLYSYVWTRSIRDHKITGENITLEKGGYQMLHIHKNVDGTYYIDLEIRDDKDRQIIRFHGNFQRVEGEREQDIERKFEINVPVLVNKWSY